ncbi:MAG: class I SAM-dependent methyltransferase [Egibacteraceae bacterium]
MTTGHRWFAAAYDWLGAPLERGWLGERRERLLACATGAVLEIGAGTGANLPHYRGVARVVLAEPDPFMRAKLHPKLQAASVPVEVIPNPAEALGCPDSSVDTVVSTLVLCTVADVVASLAEIRRVLRPGARLLFLEHVRGEGRAARWQDRLEPVWRRLGGGCHPNRATVEAIEDAGFVIAGLERFRPPLPQAALMPMVQGIATRAQSGNGSSA